VSEWLFLGFILRGPFFDLLSLYLLHYLTLKSLQMKKIIFVFACFCLFATTISAQCTFKIAVDTVYQPACYGQSSGVIKLKTINARLPVTYNWGIGSGGQVLSSIPAGKYSVTATDNLGCRDSILNIQLIQPDTPTITVLGITPASGTMPAMITLIVKKGNRIDTLSYPIFRSGLQNITIVNSDFCPYGYTFFYVLNAVNDLNNSGLVKFEIIQNSTNNTNVFIQFNEEKNCELNVFTINGQQVHNQSLRAKESALIIKDLPSGLLLFSLKFKDKLIVKKVVLIN
jgi:hypothetical protein